jgi:hypothetical protein
MCFLFPQKIDQVDLLVLDEVRFSCMFTRLLICWVLHKMYKSVCGLVWKFQIKLYSIIYNTRVFVFLLIIWAKFSFA